MPSEKQNSGAQSAPPAAPGLFRTCVRHPLTILLVTGGFLGAGAGYLQVATPQYTSSASLSVRPGAPRPMGGGDADAASAGSQDNTNFLNTERAVLTSTPLLAIAASHLDVGHMRSFTEQGGNVIATLKRKLRVSAGKHDDILTIEFDSPSPKEAADVVNAVVNAYMTYQSRQRHSTAAELLRALEKESAECEAEIASIAGAQLKLKQGTPELALGGAAVGDGQVPTGALQKLKEEAIAARLLTAAAESSYRAAADTYPTDQEHQDLLAEVRASGEAVPEGDESAEQARALIFQLQQQMEVLSERLRPMHPQMVALRKRLDHLRAVYVAGEERRLRAAQVREQILADELQKQQRAAQALAAKVAQYQQLDSELKQLERHSDVLTARMKEIKINADASALNIGVIEPGAPADRPSKPDPVRTMALALACGVFMGVGGAYLKERVSPGLRSGEDVRSRLGLRLLGSAPRSPVAGRGRRGTVFDTPSEGAAAYRRIQAAMRVAAPEGARTFLVTSASPREGKTVIAGNLAAAVAREGRRALLIDINLRRPAQHLQFGLDAKPGVSELLRGQMEPGVYVEQTSVAGLNMLPAGGPVEDPVELLNSERFLDVLEILADEYDAVIVDGPAVSAGADAAIVAASCDATVLVVRPGRVDRRAGEETYDTLANVGATLVGVVMNDAPRLPRAAGADPAVSAGSALLELSDRVLDASDMVVRDGVNTTVGPVAASAGMG